MSPERIPAVTPPPWRVLRDPWARAQHFRVAGNNAAYAIGYDGMVEATVPGLPASSYRFALPGRRRLVTFTNR